MKRAIVFAGVQRVRRLAFRLRKLRSIFPVETARFNRIIADLSARGWRKVGEYRGVDAWIDYGRIVLKKGRRRLVFEWDNWDEGSIEGKADVIEEIAAAYRLPVIERSRWSPTEDE